MDIDTAVTCTCFDKTRYIIILSLFKTHKATFILQHLDCHDKMKHIPGKQDHNIRFLRTDYQNALKSKILITLLLHLETCS